MNLCKKGPGKKVSGKKPGNKNFGKKSEFSQVPAKKVTGNKVLCFGFLGLFSKISMEVAKKVLGNKITGNKVLKKYFRRKKTRKKVLNRVKMRLSLSRFHKKDFFMHLYFE